MIAVTGTNGKSTTTALITHILRDAGFDVQMGGNIGTPVLSLKPPTGERVYVLECSSFQIELTPGLNPHIGILLNLSPDHLERHGTFKRYAELKARLVNASKHVVMDTDTDDTASICGRISESGRHVSKISTKREVDEGISVQDNQLMLFKDGKKTHLADLSAANSLRGLHNAQNAAAAALSCLYLGVDKHRISESFTTFPGLAHRMEEVAKYGSIVFINDSKATNADAASRALSSFENIRWIAGGRAKSDGIAGLKKFFPRIAKAYLIGEAAVDFSKKLTGNVPVDNCGNLETAVETAFRDALAARGTDDVILLSPACASFDQFQNFETRGEAFRTVVKDLLNRHVEREKN